jgi:hypothetical protein
MARMMVLGRGMSTVGASRGHSVALPKWAKSTNGQGVSRPDEEMDYLPLIAITLATGVLTGTLLQLPQRPFRGERPIFTAVDLDDGSDVSRLVSISPAIFVGMVPVGGALGQMPISTFQPGAFGVRLSFPEAGQGTRIEVPLILAANTSTLGIHISGGIIGRAVR